MVNSHTISILPHVKFHLPYAIWSVFAPRCGGAKSNLRAPVTVTAPGDNNIRQLYFEKFDKICPILVEPPHFDDVCDIGTTFLGCNSSQKSDLFQLEDVFPINSSAYVTGQLPDNQVVECLIDTGALCSIMTKAYYDACPSLAKLPKLKSCQEHCLVSNGPYFLCRTYF